METLKELADAAKTFKKTQDKAVVMIRAKVLLPCEAEAKDRLIQQADTLDGNGYLDERFPRLDLAAAMTSSRTQQGVPFPVPRFVAFNVDETESRIGFYCPSADQHGSEDVGDNHYLYGRAHKASLDAMGKRCRQRLSRRELALRLPWLAVTASLLWYGIAAVVNHGSSGPWYEIGAIIAGGLSAMVLGISTISLMAGESEGTFFTDASECLTMKMGGVIPGPVRERIKAERKNFDKMYIVAEAGEWTYKSVTSKWQLPKLMSDPDPLVVGMKNGVFYLVDKFDLSPLEGWLEAEFKS